MEEPQEVHTDENRALPEKKQKRIVKTPAQVAALENFYNEHKYPTEGMKQELADSIGLTEKQVSGWFCHRRLKDKKSPNDEILPPGNGKQDRSSGVIQDRGSGLRQDSCGSTKQGDNKHSDPKEVESRRFTTQNILPLQIQHNNIIMDHHHHDVDRDDHDGNDDDDDDTSSGSSSPLKDSFHPQNVVGAITSKYPSHDFKSVRGRGGPSGYLKVKGQVENAAITAVKRQLGRQYREDGPPLGIEFEALPPGAFENPVKIPVNQSYYVGDRSASALHSSDGSRTFQPPNASKMYERYNPKSYNSMDLDNSPLDIRHASKHREKHFDNQCNNNNNKQTPHFSKNRHSQSMEVNDDSAEETSIHDMRDHFETRIKHVHGHGPGVRRQQDSVSVSNRHLIGYGKNINHNIRPPPKVNYRDRVESLTSDLTVKRGEFLELEDRGMSRKIPKDEEFDGERRGIDEYSKLVSARIHPGNEMKVTKRSREEFLHQMYPRKEAVIDMPPRTIMTRSVLSTLYASDMTKQVVLCLTLTLTLTCIGLKVGLMSMGQKLKIFCSTLKGRTRWNRDLLSDSCLCKRQECPHSHLGIFSLMWMSVFVSFVQTRESRSRDSPCDYVPPFGLGQNIVIFVVLLFLSFDKFSLDLSKLLGFFLGIIRRKYPQYSIAHEA